MVEYGGVLLPVGTPRASAPLQNVTRGDPMVRTHLRATLAVAVMLVGVGTATRLSADTLQTGAAAPNFSLPSQEDTQISLSQYKGKWVVLYFYPKDMTTGCTIEAHNFQRDLPKYDAKNAVILGVSMQDEKSHQEFCAKESLTFKLLADTNKEVSEKYDSVMNLGVAKLSARHT